VKVKIQDGYQGPPNKDGEPSQPGDVVEVDDAEGQVLIDSGIAKKVTVKARTAKNKAVTTKTEK
jgi:hypothetical protein